MVAAASGIRQGGCWRGGIKLCVVASPQTVSMPSAVVPIVIEGTPLPLPGGSIPAAHPFAVGIGDKPVLCTATTLQ